MSTASSLVSSEEPHITNLDLCETQERSLQLGSNAPFLDSLLSTWAIDAQSFGFSEYWPETSSTSPPLRYEVPLSWGHRSFYPPYNDEALLLGTGAWHQSPGGTFEPWQAADCTIPAYSPYADTLTIRDESFDSHALHPHDMETTCTTDNSPAFPVSHPKSPAGIRESPSLGGRRCDWPDCLARGPFKTVEESKLHVKWHACNVREKWKLGERCTWHGCSSRALHKTVTLFDKHLNNIHINPLICTIRNCCHKTPFRANAELQRHIASVHAEKRRFKCPYKSCGLDGRVFSRRDKLICHLRGCHDTHACPYSNCLIWMETSVNGCESTAKHIAKMHGNFECALYPCEGSESQFLQSSLLDHLQIRHDMDWEQALKARDAAKGAHDYVLRDEHIPKIMDA